MLTPFSYTVDGLSRLLLPELFDAKSDTGYHQQTETTIQWSRRRRAAATASASATAITGGAITRSAPSVVIPISAVAVAIVVAVAAAAVIAVVAGSSSVSVSRAFGIFMMTLEQIHEIIPSLVEPTFSVVLM